MELLNCPNCGVSVSVATIGGEPFCPRCRTRLSVPETASAIWPVLESVSLSDEPGTVSEWTHGPAGSPGPALAPDPTHQTGQSGATLEGGSAETLTLELGQGTTSAMGESAGPAAGIPATVAWGAGMAVGSEPVKPESGSPVGGTEPRQRSRWAWQALLTYASLVTLLALYLAWQLSRQPARSRLDLPDLAPPLNKGARVTTLLHVSETQRLPASHVLRLGETRQFGSVEVTPLRVTRGPLRFEYFDKQTPRQREASEEVWRLHVRFRNLSEDLPVTPLDRHLVYAREEDRQQPGRFKANNFLARWERERATEPVPLFDLSPDSDWVVVDQNLDLEVPPGGTVESFLASEPVGPELLSGPLTWRVHFRKGHNPKSLRGVTTVVEVRFDSGEVEAASAEAPPGEIPAPPGPATSSWWGPGRPPCDAC